MICRWIPGHLIRSYSPLPADASCWTALEPDREYPITWHDERTRRAQVFVPGRQWSLVITIGPCAYRDLPRRNYDCGDEDY